MVVYSIIIPVYNEKDSISNLWKKLESILNGLNGKWEMIFINDGSTDDSYEQLLMIAKKNKSVKIIKFLHNKGKAAALQAGFRLASGEYIVTMDADLQDDPNEIPRLIKTLEQGYDLVSGWKKDRRDPWHKTIPSFFFNTMVRKFSGVRLHDINCGLKAYRKEVVKSLTIYGELYRFIPVLAKHNGFKITEITVKHYPRRFGKSKYGISRFMRGFLDLFTVLFLTKFIKRPLHLFGPIGLLLLAVGIIISGYLTFIHFAWGERVGSRPLLSFGIMFILAGLQLIFTGLIAELVTHYGHQSSDNSLNRDLLIVKGEDDAGRKDN